MDLNVIKYDQIKGFNYIPSYAHVLTDVMDDFDAAVWEKEMGYALLLYANSLRIWFSSISYRKNPMTFI